jgi:PAS domain-containing protein
MQVVFSIINTLCVVFGVLAFLIVAFVKRHIFSFRILAVTLFIEVSWSFISLLLSNHLFEKFPHLYRLFAPTIYLLGPSFYLFFRALFYNETKFRKWDWLHALPFLLHTIELMPFYLSPVSEKLIEIHKINWNTMSQLIESKEGFLVAIWHSRLKGLSIFIYTILSLQIYIKFKNISFDSVIEKNKSILKFAYLFLIIISLSQLGLLIPMFSLLFFPIAPIFSFYAVQFSNTIILTFLIGYLFFNPSILYGLDFNNIDMGKTMESLEEDLRLNEAKLRAYLVSENEMLIFVNQAFKIVQFNHLAERKIRQSFMRQIQIGEDYRTYLHEKREQKFITYFNAALKGERSGYEIELSLNGHDLKKWHKIEFIPVYDETNEITGIAISTFDIHAVKQIEFKNKQYAKQIEEISWRETHLLRAPISNLLGITKLLNKPDSSVNEEEKKALLQIIEREVLKMDVELKDIVDIATNKI